MTGAGKPSEADEVLEFLDSLPDGAGKKGGQTGTPNAEGNEDILEFLDELEQSNLKVDAKKPAGAAVGVQKTVKAAGDTKGAAATGKAAAGVQKAAGDSAEAAPLRAGQPEKQEVAEELHDPIKSLSNWWSSSGQATVSSIWSKTTERATQLKDRITLEQQDLTTKLNTNPIASKLSNATMLSELTSQLTKFVVGETEEVLRIHLVHDLVNFHDLSYEVESQFHDVLSSQVQGGIRIFVDQWDRPNESAAEGPAGNIHGLNMFQGKPTEGDKLCRANLDNAMKLFQKAMEESRRQRRERDIEAAADEESRISDVFIGILAVGQPQKGDEGAVVDSTHVGSFSFTIHLEDMSNGVSLLVRSQGFPIRWAGWLEGKSDLKKKEDEKPLEGEIDPSEWVKDWIDKGLALSIGVLAQNYVIERMGV
ncbi:AFL210Cp [Eremothecium gossypii ATCC 10895]|uniref:AFL210Cp n=1 Tax=Eremothecium gossypii (strain ATCC 10895 / CBS 109.51 / FGSC 9923 / NRRL Y-1056) TaxID=284811 RepID=Q755M4_EREGS|nr:AFL210Cp [Eremothecium gossypii ATCC 10895]AAS53164.2 AFL210Cp [Eremothecium gossypii ATCC 10895]